ncbi:hypothetical protein ACEYXF_03625 [Streptomyces asiaticus]|uniref:hypothetical protein n=1 Tax=Streptomyces asiaticus TaxID=114695 RepID=UPI0039BDEBC3
MLSKLGSYGDARSPAVRARTWGEVSGSSLTAAVAAIVLRHDRDEVVLRLMASADSGMEVTGLRTDAMVSRVRADAVQPPDLHHCPGRTTRGGAGDVGRGRRAARHLPHNVPAGRLSPISPTGADLYAVGVHWALGDAGAALEAG